MNILKEWTGMNNGNIVFDTDYDNWSENTSCFEELISKCKNIVFLIEDENNEKYGFFSSVSNAIFKKFNYINFMDDKLVFAFNIQSNRRLEKPMKFELQKRKFMEFRIEEKQHCLLIDLSGIVIWKYSKRNQCYLTSSSIIYPNNENIINGKSLFDPHNKECHFTLKRLVCFQMI